MTIIVNNVKTLRAEIAKGKAIGKVIGLVPTMGALHDGHLSLVRLAHCKADIVVVSIFVNPTQFGANEDLDNYPSDIEGDISKLENESVDIIYIPSVADIYPNGMEIDVKSYVDLSNRLCGIDRPGHFDGVVTVVSKLLEQVSADIAIFGEKDYQQLQIIRHMVDELHIDCEVIGAPIMREHDGLAMSSRNAYLSDSERLTIAPKLYKILSDIAHQPDLIGHAEQLLLDAGFANIDYVELVDAVNLKSLEKLNKPARLLAAARIGNTRLIDNIAVEVNDE